MVALTPVKSFKSEVLEIAFFIVLKDKKEYQIKHDLSLYELCPFCRADAAQAYLFRNNRSNKFTVTYKTFFCKSIEMKSIKNGDFAEHVFFSEKQRQDKLNKVLKKQVFGD